MNTVTEGIALNTLLHWVINRPTLSGQTPTASEAMAAAIALVERAAKTGVCPVSPGELVQRWPNRPGRSAPGPLWNMSVADACRLRWQDGRRQYGGAVFQGDPAGELYEELVDGLNYLMVMKQRGLATHDWGDRVLAIAEELRASKEEATRGTL